ncbi:DNA topoisomerase III [Clostridium sp. CT7]|uniref:DNA topoisomerase III n=2 Tax=Clostridium TaxID=1485 RepID=UPI00082632BE|nr:DNA topoisomerase III [Clostridium sp. CT7]PJI08517.1 DNA topoisomerase III [Clostridium sp. CT7]
MGKVLVVSEKPSVGRDIARVLNCKTRGEGCLIGNKYIVAWAVGHLVTLWEPEEYNPIYKKWRFDTLPMIPKVMKIKPIDSTKKQFNILKKLMNSDEITSLICATDAGREGELIFRYTYEAAGCNKPFNRLWISSMTDEAIKEGFESIKPGVEYDNLYYSAKCRSEADWLVGMNASRAYTLKYNVLLSVGRVQTPTLAIMTERQKEIDNFNPKDYWEVIAKFDGFKGTWFDKETNETKIMSMKKAQEISDKVNKKTGKVIKVENNKKKQVPPLLYDLTELQRDCNKKFGFSAQKTLDIIQNLYEKRKMVTYPRTDSRYLSHDMPDKVKSTIAKLNIEPYREFSKNLLSMKKLPFTKRIIDDSKVTDHHAIIPTDVRPNISSLTKDEFKAYDLIVKRFMCVFYPNYEYTITKITTEVCEEHFLTRGKTILKLGWMEFYKDDSKSKKNDDDELPKLKKNDDVEVKETEIQQKKTKPPSAYNEASLLSAMENAGRFVEDEELREQLKEGGIGTPATRAAIIERLISVGYIKRKGKTLQPTDKGMKLIEIVPPELKSPETTGRWEKGLTSIARGKMASERFMQSIQRYVRYIIQESAKVNRSIVFEDNGQKKSPRNKKPVEVLGKCPLCKNGDILENSKAFYCSNWKAGCKFTSWKNALASYGIEVNKELIKALLKEGTLSNVFGMKPNTKEKTVYTLKINKYGAVIAKEQ